MHRSKGLNPHSPVEFQHKVIWPDSVLSVADWLKTQPIDDMKTFFDNNGYLVVRGMLGSPELEIYQDVYDRMLRGDIDASLHRHDLGSHGAKKTTAKENICQIMWPSLYVDGLKEGPAHQRCLALVQALLGPDMAHDFDMMIAKPPHTDTITPWHCDESYWLDLPDKRAVSCWIAMDATTLDNGCMWFAPGSHQKPIRPHRPAAPGVHVLTCDGTEDEGVPVPLFQGSCTFHGGRTMHYSRGNTTDGQRRGFIVNFRPEEMVRFEREHEFDHGYKGLTDMLGKSGQTHADDR